MILIGNFLILAIQIYMMIVVLEVVINWLIVFGVLKAENPKARNLLMALNKATEPVYKVIRPYTPVIAGIELSPLIVVFGLQIAIKLIEGIMY